MTRAAAPPTDATVPTQEPRPRRRPGPQLPPRWKERYLAAYETLGGRYLAAKQAGVSIRTVERAEAEDPDFARQVEDALQLYADSHVERMTHMADKGNVVASIVQLKRIRPADYIERTAMLTVTANVQLAPDDGRDLLARMLLAAGPATHALIDGRPRELPAAPTEGASAE